MSLCGNQEGGQVFEAIHRNVNDLVEERKKNLLVRSIIQKLDTDNQIPGAINTWEAVTYIDASHDT